MAGHDTPTESRENLDGVDITRLPEAKLTRVRRETIGFVFQFFNLLPMLTAEENVTLPLAISGEKIDRAWLEGCSRSLASPTGGTTGRPSSPAARRSGAPSRAPSSRRPRSSSP